MEKDDLIPSQKVGQQSNAIKEKKFSSILEAKQFFVRASARLLEINHWQSISATEASHFQLFDDRGSEIERIAAEGDFIRIDILGTGALQGHGYDWVRIESMEYYSNEETDIDFTIFVARPSRVPGQKGGSIANFFSPCATSTFLVFRQGNILTAEVHGRNEVRNLQPDDIFGEARNLMINVGSEVGMSFIRWNLLVSGVLS